MCEKCGYVEPDSPALIAVADSLDKLSKEFIRGLVTRMELVERSAFLTMEYICDQQAKAA